MQKRKDTPKKNKLQNGKKTTARLLSYVIKDFKVAVTFSLICIAISAFAGVLGALFIKILIDNYITPLLLQPNPVFTGLLMAVAIMGLIFLIGVIAGYVYNRLMVVVAQGVLKKIRDEMFAKMQTLPIQYFDSHSHGDIMSHYTNDVDSLRQLLSQTIPQMLNGLLTIVIVMVAMFVTNVYLTILALLVAGLMVLATKVVGGRSRLNFKKQQKALGAVNGYIEEMINGQKVIKVFCHEKKTEEEFDVVNERLCESSTAAYEYSNIFMPIMVNLGYLQYILIAVIGGYLALGNIVTGITLGVIAAFLQLSRNFTRPITIVSQQINSVGVALAGAERIFELMDQAPEIDDGKVTLVNVEADHGHFIESKQRTGFWAWKYPHADGTITYTKLEGDVRFLDVDFGYDPNKIVLHHVTLYAKPGQKLAFVGATGAGKTTITNLINRFYDIEDGKIRYDGININKIKKNDLRHSLGIVLQDTNLFTGTVMDNLRFGRLDATDAEIVEAATKVGADGFIMLLPQGYQTLLSGDGSGLSQGQRQLLSIARAAVANPPVMILDEATASIDTRTETIVQRGMDKLMEGRTVFVIAHRLSTVRNSNAIIVLEQGQIIERGTHESLLAEKGKYYQLYTGAFELE